ncbi:MAG: transcriptional regulator [Rhodospirillaceae bacterium]
MLGITAEQLATGAKLGVATVRRAEKEDGMPGLTMANLAAIRVALEAAGVVFIDQNGNGPGVRMKNRMDGESASDSAGK